MASGGTIEIWGEKGGRARKKFRGKKVKHVCEAYKICHFYAKIGKFGLFYHI